MPETTCSACDDPNRKTIGAAGHSVDVYALQGGAGADSVFQLGVAHAHIVANLPDPSLIVGVSVGAVHAAAIADILQAPAHLEPADRRDPVACRAAKLNRFREILFAYQDFATSVFSALPDAFEADAGRPLKPNPQAIHFQAERDSRSDALRARSGLVALFNDVFRQTISVRTMTRVARAWLGLKAAIERPLRQRLLMWVIESSNLIKTIALAPFQCARFAGSWVRAYIGGTVRIARTEIKGWQESALHLWLDIQLRQFAGRSEKGYTAGEIIFTSTRMHIDRGVLALNILTAIVLVAGLILARFVPGFFFLCVLPSAFVLVACSYLDNQEGVENLFRELRNSSKYARVLAYYDLLRDLGNDYMIEDLFIRIFDPTYHGDIDMADVASRAMAGDDDAPEPALNHVPRKFEEFLNSLHAPMNVVPFVANLGTGEMTRIPSSFKIVDGLRAAVSTVPFLRPVPDENETMFYVDSGNISDDATSPAIDVLRLELHPQATRVNLYEVSPITPKEEEERDPVTDTVDVALAGLELSRFRDRMAERHTHHLYNRLLPQKSRQPERLGSSVERALACFGNAGDPANPLHFVRSNIMLIEPRTALHTNGKFLKEARKLERQTLIARAVAEGCRATLAVRLEKDDYVCRAILDRSDVPGAVEVCAHCALHKVEAKGAEAAAADAAPEMAAPAPENPAATITTTESPVEPPKRATPMVSLLFSGGVFRGVFQIGVLNALNELKVKPDIIAGSSVGSIVAAMIAHVFRSDTDRHEKIVRLASTFMTLDRLIITDRLADFVRRFTLRAAAARFSLRDADLFFRNYDVEMSGFGSVARRVVGGIEHLFYVNPLQLSKIVNATRLQDYATAYDLALQYAQGLCNHGVVAGELLGAEPLALLVKQHVLDAVERKLPAHAIPLESFGGDQLTFLLTATNLTARELQIFGTGTGDRTALIEALLASSAFPGVFRPRWSREIFFHDNKTHQYIDGGVLDNLPVHDVAEHLKTLATKNEIAFRPQAALPHLVMTASLEPDVAPLQPQEAAHTGRSWLEAVRLAKRLRYNQKIDRFAKAQRDLRFIYKQYASVRGRPVGVDTLDLDVVVVKPKWLPGTFEFHPMLGFRKKRQAASIAHGCAATFSTIAKIVDGQTDSDPSWPQSAWGMATEGLRLDHAIRLTPQTQTDGRTCHFRENAECPFAPEVLKDRIPDTVLSKEVKNGLAEIYRLCGHDETHSAEQ